MEQLEKGQEKEFELGRIEFEEGAFKRNGNIFYHFISEERIREIVREEIAAIKQHKERIREIVREEIAAIKQHG